MFDRGKIGRVLGSLLIAGLWLGLRSAPAFSQQPTSLPNLVVNGGFEQGFQDFGVGYGWGAFSNGSAAVGWNVDAWPQVVVAGKTSQQIEIKNATDRDRYAGVYQTIPVVPGQQYKLTIKGLIRSEEGDIKKSDYGYRLQYGLDYNGGTAWELVDEKNWQELSWDEQPQSASSPNPTYRQDTYETTITARSNKLTLFIRAWKKWLNNGSGLYNLDEISLVGPAPDGFQAAAGNDNSAQPAGSAAAPSGQTLANVSNQAVSSQPAPAQPQSTPASKPQTAPPAKSAQLPVSGQGHDDSINWLMIMSVTVLVILLTGAVTTAIRRRNPAE